MFCNNSLHPCYKRSFHNQPSVAFAAESERLGGTCASLLEYVRINRCSRYLNAYGVFRVLDYVEANLESELSLDQMASIACLSRYHFARAFKKAVGQSPHRYVSARRLDRAKALLMAGDRPLVEIALALGFSSQANFTRAFTQATG
ncbi:helix-turn-helix domain-containing protein [Bradyrhizobium vignae]|uniref:HTH araC/xylS-type domain-containing protein n=1 Tax=Bradyrhizobium vignae TaxID=1549949 RepID=A0A2U3Q6C7_9BRAD|nr:AraC family transcriptional regulator [Bradyrhizobium vignae]SPP96981.1 protein of unknown function [Bradyrhizobium vignae]